MDGSLRRATGPLWSNNEAPCLLHWQTRLGREALQSRPSCLALVFFFSGVVSDQGSVVTVLATVHPLYWSWPSGERWCYIRTDVCQFEVKRSTMSNKKSSFINFSSSSLKKHVKIRCHRCQNKHKPSLTFLAQTCSCRNLRVASLIQRKGLCLF